MTAKYDGWMIIEELQRHMIISESSRSCHNDEIRSLNVVCVVRLQTINDLK